MRLLVTGASGFVGGRVVELARAGGDEVIGLGRRPRDVPGYRQVDLADCRDGEIPGLPWIPDAVIHAAARATPYARLADYLRDNVLATRNVVTFCTRQQVPRLVHVSSSSVLYRDGDQLDLDENAPVGPTFASDYARTKAAGESVARAFTGSLTIARPRAVFGPGDTVLFPRILAAARHGRLPVLVGRSSPAVGDLVYIDTLAQYLTTLAHRPDLTGVYHLCNAQPVDMQWLLLEVLQRLDLPAPTRRVPISRALLAATAIERAWRWLGLRGEPPITRYGVGVLAWSKTFDCTRMLTDLGPPAVSIAEGIDRFVAWQQEHDRP